MRTRVLVWQIILADNKKEASLNRRRTMKLKLKSNLQIWLINWLVDLSIN